MKYITYIATALFFVLLHTQIAHANNTQFTKNLSVGMRGTDVMLLQEYLIQSGHLKSGLSTGYFGLATREALRKYQKSIGLPATGFFGSLTRAKLTAISVKPIGISSDDLKSINGVKLTLTGPGSVPKMPIWILFKDGNISGSVCNNFSGKISIDPKTKKISAADVVSTMMYCTDEGVSSLESKVLSMLQSNITISISGKNVTVSDGKETLVFTMDTPTTTVSKSKLCTDAGGTWSESGKCTSYDTQIVTESLCKKLGGQYASCGSACAPGAMICSDVCVATCYDIK
ncbi:MAG: META domain-containing protein [Candidatus Taylorbacteria bacterium]|nr:META domain-containing protein [Candidatus Taylorbacteria bacterium]